MDFCRYLPVELIEEIFSHLSAQDLAKCSEVSVKWREATNNGNLWRTRCKESSWGDPWELRDFESSFEDPSLRFQLPPLPDRLSPMSEWKIYYCQQKYIDYNWRQGRYAKHSIKDHGYSLNRSKLKQCALVYPIVKANKIENGNAEIHFMRIDGKPELVYQHNLSPSDNLGAMLFEGNTITFIIEKKLITYIYQNNEFNMVREYDLGPDNKLNENALKICCRLGNSLNYLIRTTSSYLFTACAAYFHVWDRNTGDELGFVNCPTDESKMDCFCLQGDCIYFVTSMGIRHTKLYEYNIVEKSLTLVDTIFAQSVINILSNEHYLILFTRAHNQKRVLFYNRSSKKKVNEITCSIKLYLHSIYNNLLFFLNGVEVRIMRVPSWRKETNFLLPYSEMSCIEIHNVGQNLLIISVSVHYLKVWDWKKGIFCSSINCLGSLVWCDPIRLVLLRWDSITNESELMVIGFW